MIKKHWPSTDNYGDFSLGEIFWQTEYKNQSQNSILIVVPKTLRILVT